MYRLSPNSDWRCTNRSPSCLISAPSKANFKASRAKLVSPLPIVKEPDLALNDRELAIDLEDVKLEELHPDLEDDIPHEFHSKHKH